MSRGERGSVTAELAIVLPAVVLVVLLVVGMLSVSAHGVRLEHGAAQAARLAGRGEGAERVRAAVAAVAGEAEVAIRDEGDLVCVRARAEAAVPLLPDPVADACALSGGR
ncbi:TadE family type IV pilus minor pilin [Microbacterium sp.]|uniref:TadE family type IV pilus minor pilin n=1 Tax=Microbacterium sp. TaxID=51671 RepID=UPI0039E6AC36